VSSNFLFSQKREKETKRKRQIKNERRKRERVTGEAPRAFHSGDRMSGDSKRLT
jgi:hypothetical protein